MSPRRPSSRTNAERTATTRQLLLDAAIESLVGVGYGPPTTTDIARRAGVARGAQLHHFPTKAELLTAAVGHLVDRRNAEFRKAFADAPAGADAVSAAIDVLWTMFQGPTFVAWVELWVAARTDPGLRAVTVEMD